MNIDGLSEATLERFLGLGFLQEFADLYRLDRYREQIVALDGFGEKSYGNLIRSIEASRDTELYRVIYGIGIAGVGLANAKLLAKYCHNDMHVLMNAKAEELATIEGIGNVIAEAIRNFMTDGKNIAVIEDLLPQLHIAAEQVNILEQTLAGMTVVITGGLHLYDRREALQDEIAARGGKASGSVSAKTSILINNDSTSNSAKNQKAKALGIPVLTEDEFVERYIR